jgi:glutaredoxin
MLNRRFSSRAVAQRGFGLGQLLTVLLLAGLGWWSYQKLAQPGGGKELADLAARSQASDVLIYSAPWCANCAAAKKWMAQQGFKYEECNVEASKDCAAQLRSLDPQGGVPYLIVKGQHMKDGFDSDEFVAALRK